MFTVILILFQCIICFMQQYTLRIDSWVELLKMKSMSIFKKLHTVFQTYLAKESYQFMHPKVMKDSTYLTMFSLVL